MACQTHPKKGRFKMKTLKERLSAKLSKNGGFTLVEMLIVVAIIAILIMVSIPMIGANLDKARMAVDDANERTAINMASTYFLLNSQTMIKNNPAGPFKLYYIVGSDKHQGKISETLTGNADGFTYGQGTDVSENSMATGQPKGNGLMVTVDTNGDVQEVAWTAATAAP